MPGYGKHELFEDKMGSRLKELGSVLIYNPAVNIPLYSKFNSLFAGVLFFNICIKLTRPIIKIYKRAIPAQPKKGDFPDLNKGTGDRLKNKWQNSP